MRKVFCFIMLVGFLAFPAGTLRAAPRGNPEVQMLKRRQKEERKALKLKKHYAKQSLRSRNLPRGVREQMKHQMQREQRELREKQKDELQDLKDRIRISKDSQKQLGQ